MGIFLSLVAVILLVWLVRKSASGRAATPEAGRYEHRSAPLAAEASARPAVSGGQSTPTRPAASVVESQRTEPTGATSSWIPPEGEIEIEGYSARGGMVYVGSGLRSISGLGPEPALIDPSLKVRRTNPDRSGSSMTYWPSYSSITPEARAAYLEWLSGGRRDPTAYIGYVFLFFYGLERRVLSDALTDDSARGDFDPIKQEVGQLLEVYGANHSFRTYASQLFEVISALSVDGGVVEPPYERTGYDLPLTTRVGIGHYIKSGRSIPASWAWSWYVTHPETSSRTRTMQERCGRELLELFRIRYEREHGEGLKLKPGRSQLTASIMPATASFGGKGRLSIDVPDIERLTAPFSKIRRIAETCEADLDAYSRWVGRNREAPKSVAAVALLPSELAITHESEEARRLWDWIRGTVVSEDFAVCRTDDLLSHGASYGVRKLTKSETVLLAQLLEKGGYGIEPDVRFGGPCLTAGGAVVLFNQASGATAVASPEYAAATVLLHLAVSISAADGTISEAEERHLERHIERSLVTSEGERRRLRAHLTWLMKSPPPLTGVRKRLSALDQGQRSAIADFIIGVAGADGLISADEIKTLGKLYPMLGLAPDDVYSHVHAMAAVAPSSMPGEPVPIIPAKPTTGFAIPAPPGESADVLLDMAAVNAKLSESAQIAALLDDIFSDGEAEPPPQVTVVSTTGKLSAAYAPFLWRLVERPEWRRADFEELAAELRLLPDGAIDSVNEAGFEHVGGPVLEGDDPIVVDIVAAKELLA